MTSLADALFDLIVAHDRIAIVVILVVVFGIVALWAVGLYGFVSEEHPRDEQQRVMSRRRVAHDSATVVPTTAEPSRARRHFTASGAATTTGAPDATSDAVERARLTVGLLPESWRKGA